MDKLLAHPRENERLAALARLDVLDTGAEHSYDRLALLAAQVCDTPMALISLVDAQRLWFKSHIGLGVSETGRDQACCNFAIYTPDAVMVVPDLALDPRFADHPMVLEAPFIRFYAGAPLVLSSGLPVGTLCVCDTRARMLEPWQVRSLRLLAKRVSKLLEQT